VLYHRFYDVSTTEYLLRKRSCVRSPHSTNICVHEHVSLYWGWVLSVFTVLNVYVFTKKVKYIFVRYLESITQI
jgi:hypothetical protein